MIPLKSCFYCLPLPRNFPVYFIHLPTLSLTSALPFPLQLLLKFIFNMLIYIYCVFFQKPMHLLKIRASGFFYMANKKLSVAQLCIFYFRNIHWLITIEAPVRMLNSFFFFFYLPTATLYLTEHQPGTIWKSSVGLICFKLTGFEEDTFCGCADVHNRTSLAGSLWDRTVVNSEYSTVMCLPNILL